LKWKKGIGKYMFLPLKNPSGVNACFYIRSKRHLTISDNTNV
jgi:hypothetical protein